MLERLIPCAACSRHVKSSDAACPFCKAPMLPIAGPVAEPFRRMAAAAAVAAGVVALTGCSSSSSPTTVSAGDAQVDDASEFDGASVGVFYGLASVEDATIPGKKLDASDDGPSLVVFYGAAGMPVDQDAAPDGAVDGATDASTDATDNG
jgi:hypothetical protein